MYCALILRITSTNIPMIVGMYLNVYHQKVLKIIAGEAKVSLRNILKATHRQRMLSFSPVISTEVTAGL